MLYFLKPYTIHERNFFNRRIHKGEMHRHGNQTDHIHTNQKRKEGN